VADVEIGLGAVLGHEHLAVLERAHRPGIDVDVRVEFLDLHLEAARLEQAAERRRGDALAERRDDTAGDEYVLHHLPASPAKLLTGFHSSSLSSKPTAIDGRDRAGQSSAAVCTRS
jgi:hypothetical protein